MAAARGEVWLAELDPVRGHELAGRRPCMVLSVDTFNRGPGDLGHHRPAYHRSTPTRITRPDHPAGGWPGPSSFHHV
ncbi:MAG: type II toxin-antitoxin system PemK/MazF family toxin [Chloroflexota bacterium]